MRKSFIYNSLLTISNLLFPLITFPYLSRILGADGIGICNFIQSYSQNYITVAALGIPVYGVREIAKLSTDKEDRSKLFFEIMIIHLAFSAVLLIAYTATILLSNEFANFQSIGLLGGSFILMNVFSIEWMFTGMNDFKFITIRTLIIRIISILLIFILVRKSSDYFIYFIILTGTVLLTVISNIYHSRHYISRKVMITAEGLKRHLKPLFILGSYIVLTSSFSSLPSTLLGFLNTKASVGYYYGANRIVRIFISLFSALTAVLVPRINLISSKGSDTEYRDLLNRSMKIVVSFGIPLTVFVFLSAEPLVLLLASSKFASSILPLKIMSPLIFVVAIAEVFVLLILSVHRKDKELLLLSSTGMALGLAINLLFIPKYGENAAAFAQLASEILVTSVAIYLANKIVRIQLPLKLIMANIIMSAPFILITYLCHRYFDTYFLRLLAGGTACLLYFLFYQIMILKNEFIIKQLKAVSLMIRKT